MKSSAALPLPIQWPTTCSVRSSNIFLLSFFASLTISLRCHGLPAHIATSLICDHPNGVCQFMCWELPGSHTHFHPLGFLWDLASSLNSLWRWESSVFWVEPCPVCESLSLTNFCMSTINVWCDNENKLLSVVWHPTICNLSASNSILVILLPLLIYCLFLIFLYSLYTISCKLDLFCSSPQFVPIFCMVCFLLLGSLNLTKAGDLATLFGRWEQWGW